MKHLIWGFFVLSFPFNFLHADLNNGLVAWYTFDGNSSDMSGNGKHGTLEGATLVLDRNGKADRAYSFDGVNDRMVVDGPWISGNSPRTVSIWAKSESWAGNFFTFGTGLSYNDRFSLLALTNSTSLKFVGERNDINLSVPAYHQTWKHFVLVYDGSILTLFVNNASCGSFSKYLNTNGSVSLVVGSNSVLRSDEYFKGDLDELRVYSRALSESEISALYNLEKPKIPLTDANFLTAVNLWFSDETTATATYGHISDWDVSAVTDMTEAFMDRTNFNEDISNWDVSNVTTMVRIFYEASSFNQDISNWDISSVTTLNGAFRGADSFNQDIGNWNTSAVTDISYLFAGADSFNQNIGNWDVSNVRSMLGTFRFTASFNQDLSTWDTSSVTNIAHAFELSQAFNQDLSGWNISSVTDMTDVFKNTSALSDTNKGEIHKTFLSNPNWPHDWRAYVLIDDSNFQSVVNLWFDNQAEANATYGHISDWDLSAVTNMEGVNLSNIQFGQVDFRGVNLTGVNLMN